MYKNETALAKEYDYLPPTLSLTYVISRQSLIGII